MNKMRLYKVTLEPKDWFFFGGNTTFDNGVKTSYIARSTFFPQQTALLGMIRYQLLKQSDLLFGQGGSPNSAEVKSLIGEESFSMTKSEQTFGDILELSPVFLEEYEDNEEKHVVRELFPIKLTKSYDLSFESNVRVCMTYREKKKLVNDNGTFHPKDYDNYEMYGDKDGRTISTNDVFKTRMQVGITKNTDHKPEEDEKEGNFFKHMMIRFCKDKDCKTTFRFAFYVKLYNQVLKSDFVFLGAERSCFDMKASPIDGTDLTQIFLMNHPSKPEQGEIEILSPTYVEKFDELNDLCDFHWSFLTPFRNLTFAKNGQGKLNSGKVSYNRSETCYNMLNTGSILFFDEKNRKEIESLLDDKHLQSIGYNYYNSMNNQKTE